MLTTNNNNLNGVGDQRKRSKELKTARILPKETGPLDIKFHKT